MQDILLSIAIPTFNRADILNTQLNYLHDCLNKLSLSQDVELLVVDNHSTDHTREIVNKFSFLKRQYNFKSIRNDRNLGGDRNFIIAIEKSSGTFVWTLADDDAVLPDAIAFLHDALSNNKEVGFCFINYFNGSEESETAIPLGEQYVVEKSYESYLSRVMLKDTMISSCVFNKNILSEEDLFKYKGESYQQLYWSTNILQMSKGMIIEKPFLIFRHPGVYESRKTARERQGRLDEHDFYLKAHLDLLKYIKYVRNLNVTFRLSFKLFRLSIDENFNQIIYHKITSKNYNLVSIKKAIPTMIRMFYLNPSFWLLHLPILVLPSLFAKKIEPYRWKYIGFRANLVSFLRRIFTNPE